MKKTASWLVLFSLILVSCVDEIYLDIPAAESNLVIDAWLGPSLDQSYVRVYTSAPFLSGAISPNYGDVAVKEVYVEEEGGEKTYFRSAAGSTKQFQAGRKYRLTVVTQERGEYQSAWVMMPEQSFVEKMEIDPKEKPVIVNSGGVSQTIDAVVADLSLHINNPSQEEVGFYIETDGISEVFTTGDSENCTCNCYLAIPYLFGGMNLESSKYQRDNSSSVKVGELNITSLGRFYTESKIKTVAKENLEYFRQIDKQQRSTGSIFDPAPFKIKGNIKNLKKPEEEVMGNFMVFQETTFSQMLYRSEIYRQNPGLSFSFEPTPHVKSHCSTYYTDALPFTPEPFKP